MSKVICDICGTSFPESATQCPICGCVRPAEAVCVPDSDEVTTTGYTYVKGGRFSKANVRKRNQMAAQAAGDGGTQEQGGSGKKTAGLIIVISCFVLIIACLAFFAITQWSDVFSGIFSSQNEPTETERVACESIEITNTQFTLNSGESAKIELSVFPYNTTDDIAFTSSDKSVATVSISGKIQYVGAGEADITVTCGDQSVVIRVICQEAEPVTELPTETDPPLPEIELDRTNIVGEDVIAGVFQWPLYDQQKNAHLPVEEITWVVDDPEIASVDELGVVYAQAEGTTVIRAMYNGSMLASCNITVIDEAGVTEPDPSESTEPSQVAGDLTPYTQYGSTYKEGDNRFSITAGTGDYFDLCLKDADGNQVSVAWSVKEGECILYEDGKGVQVDGEATCRLEAEYDGKTYILVIY